MADEYGGLRGAYRYAYGESSSRLFRSYVVVSALVGLFVAIVIVLGTVTWLANPTGLIGERALLWVIGLFVLVPLATPVLVVARRHRLDAISGGVERLLATTGYLFVLSWYLALIVTDPEDHDVGGPLGPVVDVLDGLPRPWGIGFPAIGATLIVVAVLLTRSGE